MELKSNHPRADRGEEVSAYPRSAAAVNRWRDARLSAALYSIALVLGIAMSLFLALLFRGIGSWLALGMWVFLATYAFYIARYGIVQLSFRTAPAYQSRLGALLVILGAALVWVRPLSSPAISIFCMLVLTGLGVAVFIRFAQLAQLPDAPPLLYPESEEAIIALVERAVREGRQIRVRGAGHSLTAAIGAEPDQALDISLDRFDEIVHWDDANMQVTVRAGCRLGTDPNAVRATSKRSLLRQLDARGWALPDLGGITHQSVAGFLSTGSAGGSVSDSVGESVVRIRLIDGIGRVRVFEPDPENPEDEEENPFYAAGVSLGLLGIITEVTFQCVPRYDVAGDNTTTAIDRCAINLFDEGEKGLAASLRRIRYGRVFWWPHLSTHRVQVWRGERRPPGEVKTKLLTQFPAGRLGQVLVALLYQIVHHRPAPRPGWAVWLLKVIVRAMLPNASVRFAGPWLDVLPMDNEVDGDLLPTTFTELWIDLDQASEVMHTLRTYYEGDDRCDRTGTFACELYAGKRSAFWLSPGHGGDKLRIDPVGFQRGRQARHEDDFSRLCSVLEPFEPRYHWGKYIPPAQLHKRYPKLAAFLRLRAQLDPEQIFVTAYWRKHLGIEPPIEPPGHKGDEDTREKYREMTPLRRSR